MRSVSVPVYATVEGQQVVQTRIRRDHRQAPNPVKCNHVAIRSYPIILPHELVPWLLGGLNAGDLRDTIGSRQSILDYWKNVEVTQMPWHPSTHTDKDLEHIIPVGLHGDDFRFTNGGQKLVAVSLNFPLGERRGRYVLFTIRCVTWLQVDSASMYWANGRRWLVVSKASCIGFPTLQAFLRPESWYTGSLQTVQCNVVNSNIFGVILHSLLCRPVKYT